ncbi:MAG: GTPase CgtA [Candidatus Epulonipiscioides saccharophilum]|nr:MAG: GTPase CgtA [Epulopiscium sp. AS2M-Bin001]
MFVDHVKIFVRSGKGGDGHVSFRKEKYVPNGGPDGGDGGAGGDIIFEVDSGSNTLLNFKYARQYKAEDGEAGAKKRCHGKDGLDKVIRVPKGTIIREAESNKVIADLHLDNQREVIFQGGKGGKGNQHFATPTRQAPKYAEKGRPAKEYWLTLELKMLADIGLVGFPNVGKSTLLSMISNAQPKIANYHFTTLAPNLGVVTNKFGKQFVVADIPGLVEGASDGVGLGFDFLRHIERTKVIVHVIDAAGSEGRNPIEDILTITNEIDKYNPEILKNKPQIIAANKTDISEEYLDELKEVFESQRGIKVIPISAATNSNLQALLQEMDIVLSELPHEDIVFAKEFVEEDVIKESFEIEKIEDGYFAVSGVGVEKMIGYTSLDSEQGFAFFQKYLRDKGIIEALERSDIQEGDTVRIYDIEFEYYK